MMKISKKLFRSGKKILFNGIKPMHYVVYQPIFEKLKEEGRCELYFMNNRDDLNIFKAFGVKDSRFVTKDKAKSQNWDLLIQTNPKLPDLDHCDSSLYICHGIGDKKAATSEKLFKTSDQFLAFTKVCFSSKTAIEEFNNHFKERGGDKSVLTGFQCLQWLGTESNDAQRIREQYEFDDSTPLVFYAPSWGEFGAVNYFEEKGFESVARLDANVIIKLHDSTVSDKEWEKNKKDWNQVTTALKEQYPNVRISRDANPFPYLKACDVLISDYGTLILSYQFLNKPAIFIDIEEHQKNVVHDHRNVELLRDACIPIHSFNQLEIAFKQAKEDNMIDRQSSRAEIKKNWFDPADGATEKIMNIIDGLVKK